MSVKKNSKNHLTIQGALHELHVYFMKANHFFLINSLFVLLIVFTSSVEDLSFQQDQSVNFIVLFLKFLATFLEKSISVAALVISII